MLEPRTSAPIIRPNGRSRRPRRRRGRAGTAWPASLLGTLLLSSCSAGESFPARRDHLRAHVAFLAADRWEGRLPGTAGYDSAAAYAARVLRQAGARPGWRDARGRLQYFQPVAMVRNEVAPGTALELGTAGAVKRLRPGLRTFLLLAAGRAGPPAQARPPVFVGNGVHAPEYGVDDFAGLDLSGRAVLVSAFPPGPAELARLPEPVRALYADPKVAQSRRLRDIANAGAAAILLVPDRWLVAEWDELSEEQQRLDYEPATPPGGADPRPSVPAAMLHADLVDRLFVGRAYHPISHAGRYSTFELTDVSLRLLVDVRRQPFGTENVIALVPGRDRALRREYVVVTTHLDGQGRAGDEVLPGAGDAAACAAVLETAAAVAAHPLRRSVLFVLLAAEQSGRWGSRAFLARTPVPGRDLAAVVEMGHLGWSQDGGAIQLTAEPPLLEIAQGVARGRRIEVRAVAAPPGSVKGTTAAVFAEAGVPSVLLVGEKPGAGVAPMDDVSHLDWPRLHQAARLLQLLVAELGDARTLRPAGGGGRP